MSVGEWMDGWVREYIIVFYDDAFWPESFLAIYFATAYG